jgi:hypothetical protein
MSFVIQYFRREKMIRQASWSLDIPPPSGLVRSNFAVHDADKAVILDDNGFELTIGERRKFHA